MLSFSDRLDPRTAMMLYQNEELYRAFAEAVPQIVWTAEPDGRVDFMNRRWFEYTGMTEEETYRQTKTAVHPDDYERYWRRWSACVRTGKPYEVEYRFRRASDGSQRWHIGRALPLKDRGGKILKWFGTCTDIEDQKQAEEQVRLLNEELERLVLDRTKHLHSEIQQRRQTEEEHRDSLELLRKIINTLPMAAVAADRNNILLHANDRFEETFLPERGARLGRPVNVIMLLREANERSFRSPSLARALESMVADPTTALRREFATGGGRTYSFEYIPIHEGGDRSDYILLVRDISLEKRIDNAKSEFMSLASHQLRTPLTAIRWALGRLERTVAERLSSEEMLLLRRARASATTMADTIKTMLAISQLEAGIHALKPSEVPLRAFLEELRQSVQEPCLIKGIALTAECREDIVLRTDADILREILSNLLGNAFKYTPAGGRIAIRTRREGDVAVIDVSDTGYGIPKEQQGMVFSKFFRAENVAHVDTEGTGLGLYLVGKLVAILQGTIEFTSSLNKGTVFSLTIPLRLSSP